MLNISERAISRVLKDAGINTKRLNRYTLNESFFENIDNEQKAYILGLLYADGYVHFIRGYFDGEGSIILSKHSSYHKVSGVTKKYEYQAYTFMILGTKEFIEKIVIIMNLSRYIITNTKTEEIKCLRVSAKCDAQYVFNYLYDNSTIYLERKYSKWLKVLSAFMK